MRFGAALVLFCVMALPAFSRTLSVGRLTLAPCVSEYGGYCGSVDRPLDAGRAIRIGFEFYPHTAPGPAQGTILAEEGGPGYSTTGSRDGYVRLFTPLRRFRDILLIDKRGTGRSSAIDCAAAQRLKSIDSLRDCGAQLGATAWRYSSIFAADDVAEVLNALGIQRVDYYGDSYGTFFGEVFAARHPEKLRTLVLDSAYPVLGEDTAFFPSEIENGPVAFEKACRRSPSCASLGGSASERFAALLSALRAAPVQGIAPDANGHQREVTADAAALFTIIYNAGNGFSVYRDIDAAGRAWLERHDALPLLRLVAEAVSGQQFAGPARAFSVGEAFAVTCADYDQLYDMRAPQDVRRAQYAAALARTAADRPDIFAPFTLVEAIGAPADPESLDICEGWPEAPASATPGRPVAAGSVFPQVPVLVLSGELDAVTSPREGALTTALFPSAYFVVVRNAAHETAIGNGGNFVPPFGGDLARCAGPIVLRFMASGGDPGDTSCALQVRPVRTVPNFARSWREVMPAAPLDWNEADADALRLASAAAETVGDAVARYGVTTTGADAGLRGGRFTISARPTGYRLHLDHVRWSADLAVSGTVDWDQFSGVIRAEVAFAAPGHAGELTIAWRDRQSDAMAVLSGRIDGRELAATRIAP